MDSIENNEETIVYDYEVRGRDDVWKVWYPDEGDILTPVPVYNKEGDMKSVIYAGGNSGKLTESFIKFNTAKEAVKYAKELGAENIRLVKTKARKKKE